MTTRPDSNVRLARYTAARTARRAGAFGLARLLLGWTGKLLLLSVVTSSMPACIIPVAPEFQDPEGAPNSPPQIVNPDPVWGAEVPATTSRMFVFGVTDANTDQDLYIEQVTDGRAALLQPLKHNADGTPIAQRISLDIGCSVLDSTVVRHSVMAVVADKPFNTSVSGNFFSVMDNGLFTPISWTLNLNCPPSP